MMNSLALCYRNLLVLFIFLFFCFCLDKSYLRLVVIRNLNNSLSIVTSKPHIFLETVII